MKFEIAKGRGFNDEGQTFTARLIAKKLNGYIVEGIEGGEAFLPFEDIKVIEISNDEKQIGVRW